MRQSIINKLNSKNMSKKVIEQIKVVKYFGKGEKEPTVIDNPSARELTTVAKAICPEYQKVIDQNAKLVEALREFNTYLTNRFSMLRQNAGKSTNDKSKAQFQLLNEISDKFRSLQNNKKIEG